MRKALVAFFLFAILISAYPVFSESTDNNLKKAEALNSLGLFKGSETGFDLNKPAKRAEAIVMLMRLIGKEGIALNEPNEHPFSDVARWADPYIAYAYKHQYCNGISETEFGADTNITLAQYITFLLRALGYSDESGDFVWYQSLEKAYKIKLINDEEYSRLKDKSEYEFLRDDMVLLSYNALKTKMNSAEIKLINRLVDVEGIISKDTALKSGIYDTTFKSVFLPSDYLYKTTDYLTDGAFNYYSTLQADEGLYKINRITGEKVQLNDSVSKILYIFDNWIYYIEYIRKDGLLYYDAIYKIDKSGENRALVLKEQCSIIHIDSKNIYYLYRDNLISLPHGSRTGNILFEGFKYDVFCVLEDFIYCYNSFQNTIDAFDLKLKTRRTIPGMYTIGGLAADNEYLYYINMDDGGKLYKVRLTGEGKQKLNNDYSRFLRLHSGYLFYLNYSDNFNLYKVSANGEIRSKVNDCEINEYTKKLISDYINMEKSKIKVGSSYEYVWDMGILFYKGYHYYKEKNDNFCLYREKNDLSEIKKLTQTPVSSFDIFYDRIYCANGYIMKDFNLSMETISTAGTSRGFFSISLQGTDIKKVNDESVYSFKIRDNKLFFKSHELGSTGLRYIEMVNGEIVFNVIIAKSPIYIYDYYNNCLIYTSGGHEQLSKIMSLNTKLNKETTIFNPESSISLNFYIYKDQIYISNIIKSDSNNSEYYYFKMEADGSNIQEIDKQEYFAYNPLFIYPLKPK